MCSPSEPIKPSELPSAVLVARSASSTAGTPAHKVFWFASQDRPDLPGDDEVRGACDCPRFFFDHVLGRSLVKLCRHLSETRPQAVANLKLIEDQRGT